MLKMLVLFYAACILFLQSLSNTPSSSSSSETALPVTAVPQQEEEVKEQEGNVYALELERWHIYNDNSHPTETTDGLNQALQWAHDQGYTVFRVPAGTYLIAKGQNGTIDPHGRINMVSDMTFELDDQAVIQKETNGFQDYSTLHLGVGVKNAVIKGGTYRGDRDTHDYSSGGTHESGYGVLFQGAIDSRIDGVKTYNFTGDGLCVGGGGDFMQDVYEAGFETGGVDETGDLVNDASQIRTKVSYAITHPTFDLTHTLIVDNGSKLPHEYDLFFYRGDGSFLSHVKQQSQGKYVSIPDGAKAVRLTFKGQTQSGQYVEIWNRVQSTNVTVQNSESSFNRRQGLTINGGKNILVEHNSFHDIGGSNGTAPMAGIDVEGGAGDNGNINENVKIRNNAFYNNTRYDLILYDGSDALVENNHLASKGAIGLAVSDPFTGAVIKDNHFDGTTIHASHDVSFIGNTMNDAMTHFDGTHINIQGMVFTNALLSISSLTPYGVTASDIQINITDPAADAGLTIWKNPVHLTNVTIQGAPKLRAVTGEALEGNIFDNLKVIGYNATYGIDLPPGTYNHCVFEAPEGKGVEGPALVNGNTYLFNGCTIKGNGLRADHALLDFTIRNSSFAISGNKSAIAVHAAKSVKIIDNTLEAMSLSADYPAAVIALNDLWQKDKPSDILQAIITGNTIRTNRAAAGISSLYAGVGAGPYTIENNTLYNAKLQLKSNDVRGNNSEK
ncbi:right-handed parallel beta-helix repeat-containing protein [Paenibacillus roseipurpureus]|uniref:Right-handed parallel beta-helix repeat-containing protein n=1 Tax=Paenibacillus roseopurpureus TaxID=2918901 RepID=A0AA96LMG0_9BACL|nr:right-handed parallel beta-helix repeat-containing protein [Paenibacillus sp. MBLB1832]WNR43797.1 right-handed parallel beta-helix repeat-containing protein [Paenibacillus sp. MBLB1832]